MPEKTLNRKGYKIRPMTYLRFLREKAGLNIPAIVQALGVDMVVYNKYEWKKMKIGAEKAQYIYQFFVTNYPEIVPDWLTPHILQEEVEL